MEPEFRDLLVALLKAHPGTWKQYHGYGDNGGRFTSIVDANHDKVFDGEVGQLSEEAFNLLLNFPEIADQIGIKPGEDQGAIP